MNARLAAAILLAGAAGCTRHHLPMTAAELAAHERPSALVAYLSQPDASPEVCASGRPGARAASDDEAGAALVSALRDGRVAPEVFRPCALALLRGEAPGRAGALVREVLRAHAELVADERLETDAALQARLQALLDTFVERDPPGVASREAVDHGRELRRLRRGLQGGRLGPVARRSAAELAEALELERATWQGRSVDAALLEELERRGDEDPTGPWWTAPTRAPSASRAGAPRGATAPAGSTARTERTAWTAGTPPVPPSTAATARAEVTAATADPETTAGPAGEAGTST